jgi:hypothetical protein
LNAIEERLRQRAEQEAAQQDAMAAKISQEADSAQAAQQNAQSVPVERKTATLTAYLKDGSEPIQDKLAVAVPRMPQGDEIAIGQLYAMMRGMNALILKRGDAFIIHPLEKFDRFEVEFSQILTGVAGLPLDVRS